MINNFVDHVERSGNQITVVNGEEKYVFTFDNSSSAFSFFDIVCRNKLQSISKERLNGKKKFYKKQS